MSYPNPAKYAASYAYEVFQRAVFAIGAKVANAINVAVQLQDARANNVQQICNAKFYLSDNADGHTLTVTAPTSTTVIGTNGVLFDMPVTDKVFDVITNASGQVDLTFTQTAGGTNYYLVLVTPDGGIFVSSVIAF